MLFCHHCSRYVTNIFNYYLPNSLHVIRTPDLDDICLLCKANLDYNQFAWRSWLERLTTKLVPEFKLTTRHNILYLHA